ncbi:MAG: HD domain-containing protein [Candidatus Falkowbacteria bacterium]
MELSKGVFKPASDSEKPIGQFDDLNNLERHYVKPENASAEQENGLEEIKRNYQQAIGLRERQYDQDVSVKPEMKNQRLNNDTHNEIVLGYAYELVKEHNLSVQDKVAVFLAVIFHDSGKLASDLIDHHLKGRQYAEQLLDELLSIKQDGEMVEITPELKEKVLNAIERHMNHPFMIFKNKGKRFPEPENNVDKIVFDADMMANVGFKNVCFRLTNEEYMNTDIAEASKKGISAIEETFNNVMAGVRVLDKAVLSASAKARIKRLIDAAEEIFRYLEENRIFQKIQDKYSENNKFNSKTIGQKEGGVQALKGELNLAIEEAARALNIDEEVVKKFVM